MVEQMRQSPQEVFKKGDLVKLREDLDPKILAALSDTFKPGVAYRVLHFKRHDDEGGNTVWLGPNDMSPQDVEDFQPQFAVESLQERYRDVLPIAVSHLRKILN